MGTVLYIIVYVIGFVITLGPAALALKPYFIGDEAQRKSLDSVAMALVWTCIIVVWLVYSARQDSQEFRLACEQFEAAYAEQGVSDPDLIYDQQWWMTCNPPEKE